MIDFNLYGMNLINYSAVKFRRIPDLSRKGLHSTETPPVKLSPLLSGGVMTYWELSQLPDKIFSSESLGKVSTCELEIDVLAKDIIVAASSQGEA
jgi:hypothetical protein